MDGPLLSPAERRFSLAAIVVHMAIAGITFGVNAPLTAVLLETRGIGGWLNGLVVGMPAAAMLLAMPLLPRLVGALGTLPSMSLGLVIVAAAILLQPLFPGVWAWAALRFFIGLGMAIPWLVGETWINAVASEDSRARVVALYATAIFGGFAAGPIILELIGTQGVGPFLVSAGAALAALLPVLIARRVAPPMPLSPEISLTRALLSAPSVLFAALVAGTLENAAYGMVPVYGLRSGLDEAMSLRLLTAVLLGGMVLQCPLGWLGDRLNRHTMLLGLALASAGTALLMPLVIAHPALLFAAAVLLGAVTLGIYTIGLALLGQRFPREEITVANGAFILLYELGSFVGPTAAGSAMDLIGPVGLPACLAVVAGAFALFIAARRPLRRDRRSAPADSRRRPG